MKKTFNIIFIVTILAGLNIISCKNEDISGFRQESQLIFQEAIDGGKLERLMFNSPQELLSAIKNGEEYGIEESAETRSSTFKSLLSKRNASTRSDGETYYEALGYDTIVPNKAFAVLLNPLGEVEVNDTVYRINHNGTYYFAREKEEEFNSVYQKDSIGTLIGENLYKLADGIYRYKTFSDTVEAEEFDFPDNESDDYWSGEESSTTTRSAFEPDFDSFPRFNADRQTWFGKSIWQALFGNDKYYDVKLSRKRRVRGRLYAYHYVVYSEAGVTGMMKKKNWIGWSKTQADELRIGWSNIVFATKVDDPSLKGIPKQESLITGSIYSTKIPYIGMGNLVDLYMADVEKKDLYNVISEGLKVTLSTLNSMYGSGKRQTIDAVCLTTRSMIYLVILDEMRKGYNVKSMTHTFYSHINIMLTINPGHLVPGLLGWTDILSKTLRQNKFELIGGEARICGRLGNTWQGMKIVKKLVN